MKTLLNLLRVGRLDPDLNLKSAAVVIPQIRVVKSPPSNKSLCFTTKARMVASRLGRSVPPFLSISCLKSTGPFVTHTKTIYWSTIKAFRVWILNKATAPKKIFLKKWDHQRCWTCASIKTLETSLSRRRARFTSPLKKHRRTKALWCRRGIVEPIKNQLLNRPSDRTKVAT